MGGCCFLKLNLVTVFTTICYISLIYLVFPFDFIFYKIIPPRVTIIKFNQFVTQPAMTCSKLTIETLKQGVEICSSLTVKTPERRQRQGSGVFIVKLEHTLHLVLVFLLLTLSW